MATAHKSRVLDMTQGDRKFTVEMKSVNHRYFDSNIKMPKKLSIFESAIRNLLKELCGLVYGWDDRLPRE